MLLVALDCIRRGWYVFPCWPRSKKPMTPNGFKDATNDENQVRDWWSKTPDANVAIATGPSRLCVVDIDHGLTEDGVWPGWFAYARTYAVRTGRRPEFGVQLYFSGEGLKSTGWVHDGLSGDIRCSTGYVMAAGSIHPDSGKPYTVFVDADAVPVPAWVRELTTKANDPSIAVTVDDETADGWKTWLLEYMDRHHIDSRDYEKRVANGWWLGIECPWGKEHASGPGVPSSTVLGILDGRLAFECSHGTCKALKRNTDTFRALMMGGLDTEPGAGPSISLGTGQRLVADSHPADWRELFHTRNEVLHCPPPTFLIDQFLAKASICGIAAPVGQRKSLIALNVARSLCTGEPLFGVLKVHNRPSRVLYLCPEMGLVSLSGRVRAIGMSECVQETFFLRTMNMRALKLDDIPDAALDGSVIIIDTAIRFMQGDEQASKDMRAFSDTLFRLQRKQGPDGAVICLYHSPKATKEASDLTLENCLRGSGELGAALTDAHGTRLQDPDAGWKSLSFIQHIKNRDYEGLNGFEVSCTPDNVMTAVGDPFADKVSLKVKRGGFKANQDGKDAVAEQIIREHPDATIDELMSLFEEAGFKRGRTWTKQARIRVRGSGSEFTSE